MNQYDPLVTTAQLCAPIARHGASYCQPVHSPFLSRFSRNNMDDVNNTFSIQINWFYRVKKISAGGREQWRRGSARWRAGGDQRWAQDSMAVPGRVANAGSDSNGGSGSCSCENPTKSTAAERIAEFSGGFSKLPIQKSSGNPREILQKSGCRTGP